MKDCRFLTVMALPGHTEGFCGYLFDTPEGLVLRTGDCVMTCKFFFMEHPIPSV